MPALPLTAVCRVSEGGAVDRGGVSGRDEPTGPRLEPLPHDALGKL